MVIPHISLLHPSLLHPGRHPNVCPPRQSCGADTGRAAQARAVRRRHGPCGAGHVGLMRSSHWYAIFIDPHMYAIFGGQATASTAQQERPETAHATGRCSRQDGAGRRSRSRSRSSPRRITASARLIQDRNIGRTARTASASWDCARAGPPGACEGGVAFLSDTRRPALAAPP